MESRFSTLKTWCPRFLVQVFTKILFPFLSFLMEIEHAIINNCEGCNDVLHINIVGGRQ